MYIPRVEFGKFSVGNHIKKSMVSFERYSTVQEPDEYNTDCLSEVDKTT